MHLAHCLKASVTSPKWPFFPPNSGIWILLQNPSFFFHLPLLEVEDLAGESYLSLHHFGYLSSPSPFLPFYKKRGRLDLYPKLPRPQRSVDKGPSWGGGYLTDWRCSRVVRGGEAGSEPPPLSFP